MIVVEITRMMTREGVDRDYDQGVNAFTNLSGIMKLVYEIKEERRGWYSIIV